jgi:hypothetical protein
MSIAEQEALKRYPRSDYPMGIDFFGNDMFTEAAAARDAYVAGRTAAPTEAEIEAMARLEAREEAEDGFGEPWDCMVYEDREAFRANAKRMLLAARKAVSVDE